MTAPVQVSVLAGEPLREAGILGQLQGSAGITPRRFLLIDRQEVVVADLTGPVDRPLGPLRLSRERHGSVTVAIMDETTEVDLRAAAQGGVVIAIHSLEADRDGLLTAVHQAASSLGRTDETSRFSLAEQLRRLRAFRTVGEAQPKLSEREVQVLRHLADGSDTSQTALRMHVSERTVKYDLGSVMRRHALRNRVHAVAFAVRSGVI
jgi:DNA-binding NarL/FixJ family response regulator